VEAGERRGEEMIDVGWEFVVEYYAFASLDPEHLRIPNRYSYERIGGKLQMKRDETFVSLAHIQILR